MFFYEFSDREVEENAGQSIRNSVCWRAAKAYISSGIRLESKCGISEVWYWFVEKTRTFFEDSGAPFPQEPKPILPIDLISLEMMSNTFHWPRLFKESSSSGSGSPAFAAHASDDEYDNPETVSSPLTPARKGGVGGAAENTAGSEESDGGHSRVGPGCHTEANVSGRQTVGSVSIQEKSESNDIEFEEWSSSFEVALSESMKEVEGLVQVPTVTLGTLVSPLIPEGALGHIEAKDSERQIVCRTSIQEKREFDDIEFEEWSSSFEVALSKSMGEVERLPQVPTVVLGTLASPLLPEDGPEEVGEQDGMQGVEPSQPSEGPVRMSDQSMSSWDTVEEDEDEDGMGS